MAHDTVESSVLRARARVIAVAVAALVSTSIACAPAAPELSVIDSGAALTDHNGLNANGLNANGLNANGLNANGLNANGLNANGLNANGLASGEFSGWFAQDPAFNAIVMKYVVGCAVPNGESRTYELDGVVYTWQGRLGLAPDWANGAQISLYEQQIMTACLAAHVNRYGVTIPISVLGLGATGVPIPIESGELETYSVAEGCFFGNMFTGEGYFVGSDHDQLVGAESSARACALEDQSTIGASTECAPMVYVGRCEDLCTRADDGTSSWYATCSWNGTTYPAVTTHLRPQEIYRCGDGVCQVSERCGTGETAASCLADCGVCE